MRCSYFDSVKYQCEGHSLSKTKHKNHQRPNKMAFTYILYRVYQKLYQFKACLLRTLNQLAKVMACTIIHKRKACLLDLAHTFSVYISGHKSVVTE
jgi:hypothetical protein